jgi:hypothetical protein
MSEREAEAKFEASLVELTVDDLREKFEWADGVADPYLRRSLKLSVLEKLRIPGTSNITPLYPCKRGHMTPRYLMARQYLIRHLERAKKNIDS